MISRRTSLVKMTVTGALAIAFIGCNAILENEPGVLKDTPSDTLPNEPGGGGDAQANVSPPPDGGTTTPPPEDSGTPSPGCEAGQVRCDGVCVSVNDPLYGCGDPSCKPCASSHSTMGCAARKCVVAACDKGYADCNATPGDGCETDLSKSTSCGSCNAVCGAAAPLCAPSAATFQCTNGCTPGAPLACGADCVDPLSSTNHCGGCNLKCPDVPQSTTTCTAGICGFTCKPNFHACAGRCATKTDPTACGPDCIACPVPANGRATCAANACGFTCDPGFTKCGDKCVGPNDPTACGAACTVCPAAPNAVPACAAGACGITCNPGFGNCDANPANGCEAAFASDPLNCGVCGKSCAGQPCNAGVCAAPPPPPPP
jgi:hypothetical protein